MEHQASFLIALTRINKLCCVDFISYFISYSWVSHLDNCLMSTSWQCDLTWFVYGFNTWHVYTCILTANKKCVMREYLTFTVFSCALSTWYFCFSRLSAMEQWNKGWYIMEEAADEGEGEGVMPSGELGIQFSVGGSLNRGVHGSLPSWRPTGQVIKLVSGRRFNKISSHSLSLV